MPMVAQKRPADNSLVAVPQVAKRTRNDEIQTYKDKQLADIGIHRVSNLFSPIMKLEGHDSDIFTCEFHPDGEYLGKTVIPWLFELILSNFHFKLLPVLIAKSSCGRCTAKSARMYR